MPVRRYGEQITKTAKPGRKPRWKNRELKTELDRVASTYEGSTLSKAVDVWLDAWLRHREK